jgi:hypothetical protein
LKEVLGGANLGNIEYLSLGKYSAALTRAELSTSIRNAFAAAISFVAPSSAGVAAISTRYLKRLRS